MSFFWAIFVKKKKKIVGEKIIIKYEVALPPSSNRWKTPLPCVKKVQIKNVESRFLDVF